MILACLNTIILQRWDEAFNLGLGVGRRSLLACLVLNGWLVVYLWSLGRLFSRHQ
ncbi:uncharacterized protein BDW70DRAFT_22669 [Aspergillus foveolatus]|uniref:uncharacterized protein n=1 Tax=Aspergillus foveolatus TaxID=210207 RepID=UPI003CCD8E58